MKLNTHPSYGIAVRSQGQARYELASEEAAKLAALLLLTLLVLDVTPERVRRGHVLVLVVVFGFSLTPLTCVRLAHGGGGGPPGPPATFPAYFVHTDHLGSTVLLTCYLQHSDCADGAPAQYIRYDAYGMPKAFDTTGTAVTSPITDLLYTGQRWDGGPRLYYYGALYYDPRIARFVSQDPVREYMNPYAYVRWNPVRFMDPTGMFFGLGGLDFSLGYGAVAQGILGRDFASTLLARGLGKGFGGSVRGVALTAIKAGAAGTSGVGLLVAAMALHGGQQFTLGGVAYSLTTLDAARSEASNVRGANGSAAASQGEGSADTTLTPAAYNPLGAYKSGQEGMADAASAWLRALGFNASGARGALMQAAEFRVGIGLGHPGESFQANIQSIPGAYYDGVGSLAATPISITFPTDSAISPEGFVDALVNLNGFTAGASLLVNGTPVTSPGQCGLAAPITIYVGDLRVQ